jgi:hypothetical protein
VFRQSAILTLAVVAVLGSAVLDFGPHAAAGYAPIPADLGSSAATTSGTEWLLDRESPADLPLVDNLPTLHLIHQPVGGGGMGDCGSSSNTTNSTGYGASGLLVSESLLPPPLSQSLLPNTNHSPASASQAPPAPPPKTSR